MCTTLWWRSRHNMKDPKVFLQNFVSGCCHFFLAVPSCYESHRQLWWYQQSGECGGLCFASQVGSHLLMGPGWVLWSVLLLCDWKCSTWNRVLGMSVCVLVALFPITAYHQRCINSSVGFSGTIYCLAGYKIVQETRCPETWKKYGK